jgi:two-component system, LytTR family, response regulator
MNGSETRAVIADDEAPARQRIRDLLRARPDVVLAGESESGPETIATVLREQPDVLFLDVRMPALDGLTALRQLPRSNRPIVIFTTAYDEYALQAFELRAVDYLLKPFTDDRFHDAMDRVAHLLRGERLRAWAALGAKLSANAVADDARDTLVPQAILPPDSETIVVRHRGVFTLVSLADIDWIEAAGDYVHIHVGDKVYKTRSTFNELSRRLDPRRFVRIHRSYLVQRDRIQELQPFYRGDYVVVLRTGVRLRLSRACRPAVEEQLGISIDEHAP